MTTSALRRQVKNIVHNYSEAEIKVREATSNDPWGPPSSLMSEIADLTFNTVAFAEVMGMIWRRLNDSGKNWRHVYKALTLLDYLIKTGSEKVTHQCRENLYTIQTLKDFQYVDRDGKDQGINIREKVKQVMALLKDEERLKQERAHALQTKERMALEGMGSGSHQVAYGRRASPYGEDYSRARGSPSSFNCECCWQLTQGKQVLHLVFHLLGACCSSASFGMVVVKPILHHRAEIWLGQRCIPAAVAAGGSSRLMEL